MSVQLLFRIDIGFDEARGYGAVVQDIMQQRQKGIRGNSAEQLASRLRHVLIDELNKRRAFPLESESSRIITPNGFE
jgi:hypothetical protein